MKKEVIKGFLAFLDLLEKQKNGDFEFSDLNQVISRLTMSDEKEENNSIVPIMSGEYVALISYNIFPDELKYVTKIGNFNVVVMELAHLSRVFISRSPLITWTRQVIK